MTSEGRRKQALDPLDLICRTPYKLMAPFRLILSPKDEVITPWDSRLDLNRKSYDNDDLRPSTPLHPISLTDISEPWHIYHDGGCKAQGPDYPQSLPPCTSMLSLKTTLSARCKRVTCMGLLPSAYHIGGTVHCHSPPGPVTSSKGVCAAKLTAHTMWDTRKDLASRPGRLSGVVGPPYSFLYLQ